ncbi:MAG: 2Fe-2S iron-sulfur cluster-binding protein [Cytophagales bacterium]|nr:2Fe-2S iron-sulfur cluster-binding protein [Cytophagales bacterium]
MITIKINGSEIMTTPGSTILEVLNKLGIKVPTMCYLEDTEHFPTCMICIVKDRRNGQMIPSCSTRAVDGMEISTNDNEVIEARKTGLELLLSDHVGECDAPCQTNCPAFMDIPLMNRMISKEEIGKALKVIKRDIAFPGILGRICPAPCERACRRKNIDDPVSIRMLERYAGDSAAKQIKEYLPAKLPSNGKNIGIIGTGPGGLSAAYFLLQKGYSCTLYDKNPLPGGALRYAIPEDRLPAEVLDSEIESVEKLGASFRMNHEIPVDGLPGLRQKFDAIIIASGEDNADFKGLDKRNKSFVTERNTHRTNLDGVFAIGSAIKPGRVAIRAIANGKEVATAIDRFLKGKNVVGEKRRFNSRIGKMMQEDYAGFMMEADDRPRIELKNNSGYSVDQAINEAERCMHCDCRKKDNCKLRDYADEYNAAQSRYFPQKRAPVRKTFKNKPVVYEQEKCIKCGICVKLTTMHGEELGLTYIGKGFDVEIRAPFDDEKKNALEKTAILCAEKCPTAALAIHEKEIEGYL